MSKNIALGVEIGATLSGTFGQAIGGAKTKLSTLGSEIKAIENQRGLISRFEKDQAALERARTQLSATTKELGKLKLSLSSGPPDSKTAKAMADTQAKAERLSAAIDKQRARLRESQAALKSAGLSVADLGTQYTKLGATLDQTRAKRARLDGIMSRKSAAATRLGELKGQILGVAGAVYGATKVIGGEINFDYRLRMFGNIDNIDVARLKTVKAELGQIAKDTHQKPGALLTGLETLTAKGMEDTKALTSMRAIGRAATASDADISDLATTAYTLLDAMGLSPVQLPHAIDMLALAGKRGSFELKNMATYFPELTAQAKSIGLVGAEGIATLGSALQIAMKGASDPSTAANNFQNFLAKITSPETVRRFKDMGVDIESAMRDAISGGRNPLEEMVAIIDELTGGDKFRIGDLFGDMQVISFLTPMLQNIEEYKRIKNEALSANGVLDKDFENVARTSKIQIEGLSIAAARLGSALSSVLLPAVNAVVKPLTAVVAWAGDIAERFPLIGRLIGGVSVGLGAFVGTLVTVTAATWAWNAALASNPIGATIMGISLAVGAIAGAAVLVVTHWDPIKSFFKGVWETVTFGARVAGYVVSEVVGLAAGKLQAIWEPVKPFFVGLWSAVSDAARAVTDGIGAAFASVAGTVMAVWEPIKPFFTGLWDWLKGLFNQGVEFLVSVWQKSPLGLIAQAGAKIGSWLGQTVGQGISSARAAETPAAYATAVPAALSLAPASGPATVDARVTAPITINTHPGMDEKAVATEVERKLREREQAAKARSRGALHD